MQLTTTLPSLFVFSLALLACSDPAPPIAQGGLHFYTTAPTPGVSGKTCTTSSYVVGIGNPPPALTGDDPGKRVVDGEKNNSVKCRVKGNGEVTFSGSIGGPNVLDTQSPYGVSFRINGNVGADGTGSAQVSLTTPKVGSLASDGGCTVEGVVMNEKEQWGDGLVWAQFSCRSMVDPSYPGTLCSTGGTVVLENCED